MRTMDRQQLLHFLESSKIFSSFDPKELESIVPYFEIIFLEPGDYLVREGDAGVNMYALIKGKADIFKEDKEAVKTHRIGSLEPGEWVGEMASIEGVKRSASIRCTEKCEVLVFLLDKLELTDTIFAKIQSILARNVSRKLRTADEKIVASLTENVKILQASNVLGRTIVHTFVLIAVWFNLALILRYIPHRHSAIDPIFTAGMLIVFGLSMGYIIKGSGYPISFFGLTLKNWPRFALQGVIYTIPILILLTCVKWIGVTHLVKYQSLPIFSFKPADQTVTQAVIFGLMYIITVPVQEFIIRGGIQTCFRNFFLGPNRVYLAILTSNLLFELLHTVKSLPLAIGTFIFGFFWGALLEQQKSLVGVIVSHVLVGAWAFFVLDLQTVINLSS